MFSWLFLHLPLQSVLSALLRRPLPRPSHLAPPCPRISVGTEQAGRKRARGCRRAEPPRMPDFQVWGAWELPGPLLGGAAPASRVRGVSDVRALSLSAGHSICSHFLGASEPGVSKQPRRTYRALRLSWHFPPLLPTKWFSPTPPKMKWLLWLTAGLSP